MGSWHHAIYSPRYRAFISPYILDAEDSGGEVIHDLRSEWPKPIFRLFMTPDESGVGVFNFSEMIYSGAFIEILGDMNPAPPFGHPWGKGVTTTRSGDEGLISGVIQVWEDGQNSGQRRVSMVSEEESIDAVAIDGPDPFRMVQSIFAVTGWLPKGVSADLAAPDQLGRMVEQCAFLTGPTGDTPLLVPKNVFLDAVDLNPSLVPVFGRIASLSVK
jgi:hypothetical protein